MASLRMNFIMATLEACLHTLQATFGLQKIHLIYRMQESYEATLPKDLTL